MSSKMLQFINRSQARPVKAAPEDRKHSFKEIYAPFQTKVAQEQASRCSQCGVPFCQTGCPLGNAIPDWLMLSQAGRMEEAYNLSFSTNSLPEICGRICPQDRLCEGACVIEQGGHGAVTIGSLESHISETAWANGWVRPIVPSQEFKKSVGIIGAGPAGLGAAFRLREAGIQVTIYDRYEEAGGLLSYGIPEFKLEKSVVLRRVQQLKESGVQFVLNCDVGQTHAFEDLRKQHDALLIATGVYKAKKLDWGQQKAVLNQEEIQVVAALDYLVASNREGFSQLASGKESEAFTSPFDVSGKNVVVIGGGDTAMDCLRTAVRQGAKEAVCLYRRDRKNMPGSAREVINAEEEGAIFEWLAALDTQNAETADKGINVQRMKLGPPDSTGRQSPIPIEGGTYSLKADFVIEALGFDPEDLPEVFDCSDLKVSRFGTLAIDKNMETAVPNVFAAGDIVRGASLAVWAIKDGQEAATFLAKRLLDEGSVSQEKKDQFSSSAARA